MAKTPDYDGSFYDAGRQYFERGLPAWTDFVLNTLKATSIADFGAGQGDWLELLEPHIPVWACDGYADEAHLRVKPENFRKVFLCKVTPADIDVGKRDVVMSLEAMEHVTSEQESNFLDCLLSPDPRLVVFSVASGWGTYDPTKFKVNRLGEKIPGGPDWHMQWGRHHVNCQPVAVVVEKMAARGYVVDEDLTGKFANLRAPGKTANRTRAAFASFYLKNTRIYKKAT